MCQQVLSALGYHVLVPDYRGWCKWRFMTLLLNKCSISMLLCLHIDYSPLIFCHIITSHCVTLMSLLLWGRSTLGQQPHVCGAGLTATLWQWGAVAVWSGCVWAEVDVRCSGRFWRLHRGADWGWSDHWCPLHVQLGQSTQWKEPGGHMGTLSWHWVSKERLPFIYVKMIQVISVSGVLNILILIFYNTCKSFNF